MNKKKQQKKKKNMSEENKDNTNNAHGMTDVDLVTEVVYKYTLYCAILCLYKCVAGSTPGVGGGMVICAPNQINRPQPNRVGPNEVKKTHLVGTIPGLKTGISRQFAERFNFFYLFTHDGYDFWCKWRILTGLKCTSEAIAGTLERYSHHLLGRDKGWMLMSKSPLMQYVPCENRTPFEDYVTKKESFIPRDPRAKVNTKELTDSIINCKLYKLLIEDGECVVLTEKEVLEFYTKF